MMLHPMVSLVWQGLWMEAQGGWQAWKIMCVQESAQTGTQEAPFHVVSLSVIP